jgi:hypothetical protein
MIGPVFAKSFEEMVCDRYQRSEWRSRCYGGPGGGGGLGGGGYGRGESSAIRDGGSSRGLQASADSELAAARDRRSPIGDRRSAAAAAAAVFKLVAAATATAIFQGV